jgi:hypothetical protein
MKQIFLTSFLLSVALFGFSEQPRKAVGIRGGISSGFEYRVFSGELTSYKALISFRNQGMQFTGMKEFHVPDAFDFLHELSFIYGFGAHVGFESWYTREYHIENGLQYSIRDHRTGPVLGLDGLVATEYAIPAIPLVVGIEVKPYFNLFGENFFKLQPFDFAFTVKYTF